MLRNRNLYKNISLAPNINTGVYPPSLATSLARFSSAPVRIKHWPRKELLLPNAPPCIQLVTGAELPQKAGPQGY